jgi:hypothetical protein
VGSEKEAGGRKPRFRKRSVDEDAWMRNHEAVRGIDHALQEFDRRIDATRRLRRIFDGAPLLRSILRLATLVPIDELERIIEEMEKERARARL